MAHILQIREICERALRKIGAYAIRSSGSREAEMEEARYWLDMLIGHLGARRRTWWLVPSTATFALIPGQAAYPLAATLGQQQAPLGIQFVIGAWLYDPVNNIDLHEIEMLRREDYEHIEEKAYQDFPCKIYVDRAQTPTALVYPVPNANQPLSIRLLFQGYTSDFTSSQPLSKAYSLRSTWNLYIVTALAKQLANGPVRKLPHDEVAEMMEEAKTLLADLEGYDDQEQANEPARVMFHDGV